METENWRIVKRAELENLNVTEEYRSLGIGKKLIQTFFEWSKHKGVERALVAAYATNDRVIKFYQREGFVPERLSLEAEIK